MPDYSKGKIYRIEPVVEHDVGDVYYGSTTRVRLCDRFKGHVSDSKSSTKIVTSRLIFEKYGVSQCKIFLVEDCACTTKDELTSREGYYIRNFPCVNKSIPNLTLEEIKANKNASRKKFYKANMEALVFKQKEYYKVNSETIAIRHKEYNKANAEVINLKAKEYRKKNTEVINLKAKEYYKANTEALALKQKERYLKRKEKASNNQVKLA